MNSLTMNKQNYVKCPYIATALIWCTHTGVIKGGTDKPMWNLWREEKDEEEEEQKQKVEMQGWLDGEVNRWRAVLS